MRICADLKYTLIQTLSFFEYEFRVNGFTFIKIAAEIRQKTMSINVNYI